VGVTVAVLVALSVAWFLGGFGAFGPAVRPLNIVASVDPSSAYAPALVTLTATVGGGASPYTVSWTNGAERLGTGTTLQYHATTAGGYHVTATAVDAHGAVASRPVFFKVVSPYPEASSIIPAATTDLGPTLSMQWSASTTVAACLLPGYGSLSIPAFSQCSAAGGLARSGASGAASFLTDPDDPEPSPVLFQSTPSGVAIHVAWWYNDSAGPESSGADDVLTAVAPL